MTETPCTRCATMCCDYRQAGDERICIACVTNERDDARAELETHIHATGLRIGWLEESTTALEGERAEAERLRDRALLAYAEQNLALREARERLAEAERAAAETAEDVRQCLTATLDCGHPAPCAVADGQRAPEESACGWCRDVASAREHAATARRSEAAAYAARDAAVRGSRMASCDDGDPCMEDKA